MINSIGLPNKGLEGFLESTTCPSSRRLPVPLCVSVMAPSREGFATLVERVGARDEVAAIELNVSCPERQVRADRGRAARRDAGALRGACAPLTDRSR